MPGGRPTSYDPSYCDLAIEYGQQGMNKTEIAVELGVAKSTLYLWIQEHEEFSDAIKKAEHAAERWYQKAFRNLGTGVLERAMPQP